MQNLIRLFAGLALIAVPGASGAQSGMGCLPAGTDLDWWQDVKAREFAVPAGQDAGTLALALLQCLGSPDPAVRDGIGYEVLTNWIRAERLEPTTLDSVAAILTESLGSVDGSGTEAVLRRSFSALILSEVIRQDNRSQSLGAQRVGEILEAATGYLETETDRRGFDPELGWVHGTAHGADLLWRLASSPKVGAADLGRILDAVSTRIAPAGEHFYIFGEGDRLARAVVMVLDREILEPDVFNVWLESAAGPGALGSWPAAFRDRTGLARLHNTRLFLRALEDFLTLGERPEWADNFVPGIQRAIRAVTIY